MNLARQLCRHFCAGVQDGTQTRKRTQTHTHVSCDQVTTLLCQPRDLRFTERIPFYHISVTSGFGCHGGELNLVDALTNAALASKSAKFNLQPMPAYVGAWRPKSSDMCTVHARAMCVCVQCCTAGLCRPGWGQTITRYPIGYT